MIKCASECIPCCDYCVHCIHATESDTEYAPTEPIGCSLHKDDKHREIVMECGYCDNFHCFRASKEVNNNSLKRGQTWTNVV